MWRNDRCGWSTLDLSAHLDFQKKRKWCGNNFIAKATGWLIFRDFFELTSENVDLAYWFHINCLWLAGAQPEKSWHGSHCSCQSRLLQSSLGVQRGWVASTTARGTSPRKLFQPDLGILKWKESWWCGRKINPPCAVLLLLENEPISFGNGAKPLSFKKIQKERGMGMERRGQEKEKRGRERNTAGEKRTERERKEKPRDRDTVRHRRKLTEAERDKVRSTDTQRETVRQQRDREYRDRVT